MAWIAAVVAGSAVTTAFQSPPLYSTTSAAAATERISELLSDAAPHDVTIEPVMSVSIIAPPAFSMYSQ